MRVILVVDRYLITFEKHVERIRSRLSGGVVLVRTPIVTRLELKLFAQKITPGTAISVHFPVSTSESISKSQRQFLYRDVPETEKDSADRMAIPMMQDGFDEILLVHVRQGD